MCLFMLLVLCSFGTTTYLSLSGVLYGHCQNQTRAVSSFRPLSCYIKKTFLVFFIGCHSCQLNVWKCLAHELEGVFRFLLRIDCDAFAIYFVFSLFPPPGFRKKFDFRTASVFRSTFKYYLIFYFSQLFWFHSCEVAWSNKFNVTP